MGLFFLYNDHQRYCGLNLTIIATDNRAAWHLGTLFFCCCYFFTLLAAMSQCKRTLTCGTFHVAHLQFSEPLCGQTLAQSKNPQYSQYMNVRQTATVLFAHYSRSDPAELYSHPRLSTFPTTMPVKALKFPLF